MKKENENNNSVKVKKRTRKRTIIVLAILVIALIALYVYVRGSYLEFKAIGENYIPVFWRNLTYSLLTFAVNFIFLYCAFYFTNRTLKKGLKVFFDDEKKEMPKFPNKSVSFIIALIGSIATTQFLLNNILLCFSNSQFGSTDLVFGMDISYFMFQRPFITFLLSYLLIVVIATIIYAVVYALIVLNISFEGVARESIKKVDLVSKLGSRVKLIAILLGLFIFFSMVQNIGNERFLTIELSDATQYSLFGAGDSDVTIKLWGYVIFAVLAVISVFRAYKALKDKSTRRVLGNLLIVPVYLIILAVVLAGYQLIFIGSNELDKNQEYIAENIKQTKNAFGINIEEENIDYSGTITREELNQNENVIDNIAIVSSSNVLQDLQSSQTEKGYYTYRSTQIEMYNINNKPTTVYVSPREIDSSNTTYSNKTYEYTHGYGTVITMAGTTDEEGNLSNIQKDFGDLSESAISTTEPRIYFGLETNDAVVVNGENTTEFDYLNEQTGEDNKKVEERGIAYSKKLGAYVMIEKDGGKYQRDNRFEPARTTMKTVYNVNNEGKQIEKKTPHALMETKNPEKEISISFDQYGYVEVGIVDRMPTGERVERQLKGQEGKGDDYTIEEKSTDSRSIDTYNINEEHLIMSEAAKDKVSVTYFKSLLEKAEGSNLIEKIDNVHNMIEEEYRPMDRRN